MSDTLEILHAPGTLRSFGRVSSRMSESDLKKLDQRLSKYLVEVELPEEPVSVEHFVFPKPVKPSDIFKRKNAPLTIEIGSGNGEYLLTQATANPQTNHIGIEVYKNGLRSLVYGLEQSAEQGEPVKNLKICTQDARLMLAALPEASVTKAAILYPDPWPKKRHHKRRIINTELLNLLGTVIKPGGTLFVATDWANYAQWILAHTLSHPVFELTATCPADLGMPPEGWRSTKYERKALKEGRSPWYLTFTRTQD